ncbi:TonB-dependent receptor [Terriglobus roseus]|nr:TonB-dependent receptor [Terriglobus roseus]
MHAQTPGTGAITGAVLDPSGRVVVHAEVVAIHDATHQERRGVTDDSGIYRLSLLSPGRYTITVSSPGFASVGLPLVAVDTGGVSSINVTLSTAKADTRVQVNADASLASFESATLGGLVDQTAVLALPLRNRNFTQILGLSPGVITEVPSAAAIGAGTQNVSSNGAKTTANNVQFNGVDANNLAQNSMTNIGQEVGVAIPAPDAIDQFKVQTANFDAAYGRGSGANVDVVSKTGSNHFHGTVWEFLRNDLFDANDFFLKQQGQRRPVLKQNLFGGTLGGPIRHDRTFFFLAYQGLRSSNGLGAKRTATLPLLTSDRSARKLGAQFCPDEHTDGQGAPLSGYLTHAGGTQVACDGSNINPVALAILNAKLPGGDFAIPSPQTVLAGTDPSELPVGQSTFAPPARYSEDQFSIHLDHALSPKNTLSGRFFYSRSPFTLPFSQNAANVPGWGTEQLDRNTIFLLADTHVFSANLVNVARAAYMRFDGTARVQHPLLASAIGQSSPTGLVGQATGAPGMSIDGLFTIGDAGTPSQWQVTNSFIYQDTLSWLRRRNSLRFGAEVKHHQVDIDAPFSQTGLTDIATFADFLVGQSAAQNGSSSGVSNVTTSYGASGIARKDGVYNDFAAFVQDDIRLLPRLSLNVGVRYEIFGAPYEKNGRLPNFDPTLATGDVSAGGSLSGFVVPSNFSGDIPAGVTRLNRLSLWTSRFGDVSPRFGFAWQVSGQPAVVIRGGYGIYFDQHSGGYIEGQIGQAPFSVQQFLSGSPNGGATLQNPFSPQLPAADNYPIFVPRVPFGFPFLQGISPELKDAYTQEFNLNVQTELSHNDLLQIGYVGSRSIHRPGSIEFDQALLASPTRPVNGETTNSTNNLIERLPIQGVSPGSLFTMSIFQANFNSLQASITHRMSHGFQLQGSYTYSKSLDETSGSGGGIGYEVWLVTNDQTNPRQAYGTTDFDRTHRAVLNFTWQGPRFRTLPLLARAFLADWMVSGVAVAQSGTPMTITDGNAASVYGNFLNRAQRSGGRVSTPGSDFDRVIGRYLDGAAFTRAPQAPFASSPADQDFGNSGVGIVRGPGQRNFDLTVERAFPIREGNAFRIRAEFLNLTNTTQFNNPGTTLNFTGDPAGSISQYKPSASFGRILSTNGNSRVVQLAARYSF